MHFTLPFAYAVVFLLQRLWFMYRFRRRWISVLRVIARDQRHMFVFRQACCRSGGYVCTHLGKWRQSTGLMHVSSARLRVRRQLMSTPLSSHGRSDPSNRDKKSRWVCLLDRLWSNFRQRVREHPPPQQTERRWWVMQLPVEKPRQHVCECVSTSVCVCVYLCVSARR